MPSARVVELLRGEEGTTVTVELLAVGHGTRTITVTRGPVILETLEGSTKVGDQWNYEVKSRTPIWYVNVKKINGSTVHDLRRLERRFRTEGAAPLPR
jgi:C-terminal processing protease CtpA/Prc